MDEKNLTIEEITEVIGKERLGRIREIIGEKDQDVLDWLQEPLDWLDGRSPYELCRSGKYQVVDDTLNHTDELGYL